MLYLFIQNASPRWDESGLRTGGREMTILSSDILVISSDILERSSECRRIVFISAEAIQGVSAEILSLNISWQAQYSVKLEGDFNCSVYCT